MISFKRMKSGTASILLALALLGIASLNAGPLVPVEKGDGIYSLLERHGFSGRSASEDFIRLNQADLGPGNALILGRKYRLPDTEAFVHEPLFGPKLESVKIVDRSLAGAAFYLVSGHGGPDTGAIGRENGHALYEDEYAYDVTLRLGRRLLEHGARVHFIIRDPNDGIRDQSILNGNKSELCYPNLKIPASQRTRLLQRAVAVNRLYDKEGSAKYRRCIVIHVDSRNRDQSIDTFFYHQQNSERGRHTATAIRDTFKSEYQANQPGRGYEGSVGSRNLFMLRETKPATVFVELGNIQHERDKKRILSPNNRQAVANWMYAGLVEDFKKAGK